MKFEYKIKGITLNVYELMDIHEYYQAARTAEYLMDNYNITDENKALELGYEVRRIMDKYDYDEEEAINEVLNKPDELLRDLRMEQLEQM